MKGRKGKGGHFFISSLPLPVTAGFEPGTFSFERKSLTTKLPAHFYIYLSVLIYIHTTSFIRCTTLKLCAGSNSARGEIYDENLT